MAPIWGRDSLSRRLAPAGAGSKLSLDEEDKRSRGNRYGLGGKAQREQETLMRIVGLALTGMLAVSAATPAHTDPLGSKMAPVRMPPGVIQMWDYGGSGRHSGAIGARPTAGRAHQWNDRGGPPHWGRTVTPAGRVPTAGQGSPLIGSGVPAAGPSIIPSPIGEVRRVGGVIRSRGVRSHYPSVRASAARPSMVAMARGPARV
jgi:hypothetical protein